jgi:hypothetical protein
MSFSRLSRCIGLPDVNSSSATIIHKKTIINLPSYLVLWGRYDTSFTVAGGEAYRRDDPRAEVHILDAGHFALDLKPKEVIRLMADFMKNVF